MNSPSLKIQRIPAFFVNANAVLALVLGIFSLVTCIYFWIRFHIHFPAKDTLHMVPFVQSVLESGYSGKSPAEWLAPHALAHRIAITRLAMVIDYQYFGGQNHVLYALTWLGTAALLLVFVAAFRQSYKSESVLFVFVVGISLIFLCSHTQAFNLVNPINSSWYVAFAASAFSIFLITRKAASPSALQVLAAYLLAVVAAYSNFAGVFVWFVLPVLIGSRSLRAGLLVAAISVAFIALYMHGMHASSGGNQPIPTATETAESITEGLKQFVADLVMRGTRIIGNTVSYLGAPLSQTHPKWGALLVILSLAVITMAWRELLKHWIRGQGLHNVWLETTSAITTVTLGTAITTQLGRGYFSTPTAERYQTVVMLYWLSICCLLLYFGLKASSRQVSWKIVSTTTCLAIAAALLLVNSRSMTLAVKISEAADRVSSLGILGVPLDAPGEIDNRDLLPHRPPKFLPGLNSYLMQSNTSYWYNVKRHISFERPVPCGPFQLDVKPSTWPDVSVVTAQIQAQWPKLYREISVTTAQGEVIGFLHPRMLGEVTSRSLYFGEENTWTGYLRSGENPHEDVYLHYRDSLHSGISCRLSM